MKRSGCATLKLADEANESGIDRLSELPDSLVGDIISNLPTLEAVRTMLLSKRFNNSWTWIHSLDFKEEKYGGGDWGGRRRTGWKVFEGKKFRNFVTQVLNLHQNSQLHKFNLKCYFGIVDMKIKNETVSSWLECVVTNKRLNVCVMEFGRQRSSISCGLVPQCTFSSNFLTELTLSNCEVRIEVSSSVELNSLRKLNLSTVDIDDIALKNILCGSPLLQVLKISKCPNLKSYLKVTNSSLEKLSLSYLSLTDDSLKNIFDGCPLLRELNIRGCRYLRSFVYPNNNVGKLWINFSFYNVRLRINCPNLRFLSLESRSPVEILDISSVNDSSINIPFTGLQGLMMGKVICYFNKITLSAKLANMFLPCEDDSNHVPEPWIYCLLRNASRLEELTIDDSDTNTRECNADQVITENCGTIELESVSLRKHLRKVTYNGRKKTQCYRMVVHFTQLILKNARVLEVFTLTTPSQQSDDVPPLFTHIDERALWREIKAVSVASTRVKITYNGDELIQKRKERSDMDIDIS